MWVDSFDNPDFMKGLVTPEKNSSDIHWHPRHELFYMLKGTTTYMIDGKMYSLTTGQMAFIPKGIMHYMDTKEGIYNERILLSFDDDMIPDEYQSFIKSLSRNVLIYIPPKHRSEIEQLFKKIEEEYKYVRTHQKQVISLCTLHLLTLIDRYNARPPKLELEAKDSLIDTIAMYIRENYSKNLALDTLSEQFSINKNYLSRRFKTVFEIGLNDYITYIRLLNAEKLIRETDIPITQIAAECGYNDSNYFSTAFRKFKGVSPNKYKKEVR